MYDTVKQKCTAILGRCPDFNDKRPFSVGLCYGDGDPNPIGEFLHDYRQEAQVLEADGITLMDHRYPLRIRLYVADALGRAYLKGTITHASRHGCERCPQVGPHHGHQCYATEVAKPARTDESFRALRDREHHNYISPLNDLPTHFISQFPFCAMHLLDLGLFRKYLHFILVDGNGPLNARATADQMQILQDLLNVCSEFVPVEFTRKLSLKKLKKRRAWLAACSYSISPYGLVFVGE
ncbi:hypothetical protein FOCC_FOCC012961 [Frankliniella occidentalis]|nr:hypothetical protein FOCC_FOCC012961 [Frankliniella occidentalis]